MSLAYPGCRTAIREAYRRRNLTEPTLEILIASLANGTINQYNVALKSWWKFCNERSYNPYESNAINVLEFLTESFNKGASFGTLNSARSAVSLILSNSITNDQIIHRFFKGVYRLRPCRPKYNKIWDISTVLKYLSNWHIIENLDFGQLTEKTIMLLALGTGHRVQTFSLIKIENIKISSEGIEIKIPDLIKTSKAGICQPIFFLPFFKEKPEVCVAKAVQRYLEVSKDLRGNITNLFISIKKPYKAVSAQTISRWLKTVLVKSGIKGFTAHSTRHASTSAAFKKGIDISIIKNAAGWSRDSQVFAKFYNRPVCSEKENFISSVLK